MSYADEEAAVKLRAEARTDRVGARVLGQEHIRDFVQFTDACARLKTPCYGNPDLFFDEHPKSVEAAKAKCATCPLQAGCLNFALDARQNDGVWGGASQDERRKILRARRAAKQKQWRRQREARAKANQTPLFEMSA
jgi:Transcription factor WhiB